VQRSIFPGGCFFEAAAAEFDSRPGPVRDSVVDKRRYWSQSLARAVRDAQAAGEVKDDVEPEQLAWELNCLLIGANGTYVIDKDEVIFERAHRAVERVLRGAASDPDLLAG
jgi:hypothetical protein